MTTKEKKLSKAEREKSALLALVEQFIANNKPVGSKTLQEAGFIDISPATIRNYFANLEKEGFLLQLHASGGRIPTQKAYRLYANEFRDFSEIDDEQKEIIDTIRKSETKEIASFLQKSAETLSSLTNLAVFLSAPRFDHDFIADLKVVPIDSFRLLCVLVTDFGVIQTELLHSDFALSSFAVKRIESYFNYRLKNLDKPENLEAKEESLAKKFYNEVMVRYIVGYSNFIDEEIYRTGFSKLISYSDFKDTKLLASSLALFENSHSMRLLLRDCQSHESLKFWIGDDLITFATGKVNCSVIAVPYKIGNKTVGSIGVLGPTRMPYKELFALLGSFSDGISAALTKNIYKFKINFRQPKPGSPYIQKEEHQLLGQSRLMLLEDKSNN